MNHAVNWWQVWSLTDSYNIMWVLYTLLQTVQWVACRVGLKPETTTEPGSHPSKYSHSPSLLNFIDCEHDLYHLIILFRPEQIFYEGVNSVTGYLNVFLWWFIYIKWAWWFCRVIGSTLPWWLELHTLTAKTISLAQMDSSILSFWLVLLNPTKFEETNVLGLFLSLHFFYSLNKLNQFKSSKLNQLHRQIPGNLLSHQSWIQ